MSEEDANTQSKEQLMVEDVDEALIKCGGFHKFQYFSFAIIVTGMAAGAFILYNLYYFEKEPVYLCNYTLDDPTSYKKCHTKDICDS